MSNENPRTLSSRYQSRRDFLSRAGCGFGLTALSAMLVDQRLLAAAHPVGPSLNPLAPRQSHFPAKAKSVIFLFMNGGQSQVHTWD